MKKILLTVCLISSNVFATSIDASKMLNQIDDQVKIIENSLKVDRSAHFENMGDAESKVWGHIADLYELYRVNQVNERYYFLLEATNAMSVPLDQRGFFLEEWATTMNKRAYEMIGLNPSFYKNWKTKMNLLNTDIQELVTLSRSDSGKPAVTVSKQAQKIKELTQALKSIPPRIIEREKILHNVEVENNYPLIAGAFLAGLSLMFMFRRRNKKQADLATPVTAAPINIPAMAAFNPVLTRAQDEFEKPFMNSNKLNLEEISKRCLDTNQHLFSLATLDVQHQNPSPFDTNVNISSEKLAEAMNWMIKGIISLKNTALDDGAKLDWVCKKNKDRVSVDFILRDIKIDSQKLQENAIINGDGSAPAHFGRCEQLLANHFPTVKIKPTQKHTIISLGLESYTSTEMNH